MLPTVIYGYLKVALSHKFGEAALLHVLFHENIVPSDGWSFMFTISFGFVPWILGTRNCCGGFEKPSIPQADQSHLSPVTNFRFLWFTFCFVWNFCLEFRECALMFLVLYNVQYLAWVFLFVIYNIFIYITHP